MPLGPYRSVSRTLGSQGRSKVHFPHFDSNGRFGLGFYKLTHCGVYCLDVKGTLQDMGVQLALEVAVHLALGRELEGARASPGTPWRLRLARPGGG
jgi:hypothetical protein